MRKHILLTLIIACLFVSCKNNRSTANGDTTADSTAVLITQIQKTSKLYTVEYKLHKIITHSDSKQLRGNIMNRDFNITLPMSQRMVAIPMEATVKAYVDFQKKIFVATAARLRLFCPTRISSSLLPASYTRMLRSMCRLCALIFLMSKCRATRSRDASRL